MKFHRGRLFDHVHLRVSNLEKSRRFYYATMDALGKGIQITDGPGFFFADELFVSEIETVTSKIHLAFQASSPEIVDRFYQAAMEAGGIDNGPPGERSYHPGYYGAYVLDPDGNNIETVFHGQMKRTSEAVVLIPIWP